MDKRTSSESSIDSLSPPESIASLHSHTTDTSRRSSDNTISSAGRSRRRDGLIHKIETGFQTIFRRFSRTNTTLSGLELQILTTITNFDRDQILQWHEKFLAECPHGYMTRKKFISMYKTLSTKSDAKHFARHLFRAFDLDRSNSVDFREFLIGVSMTSTSTSPQMKLEWIFQVFDIDGNGLLTRNECLEVIDTIVRFYQSQSSDKDKYDIEDLVESAKQSMMKIFDNVAIDGCETLTMLQFVDECQKNELISQLLTPNSSTGNE